MKNNIYAQPIIPSKSSWKLGLINDVATKHGLTIDWANTDIEKMQLSFLILLKGLANEKF